LLSLTEKPWLKQYKGLRLSKSCCIFAAGAALIGLTEHQRKFARENNLGPRLSQVSFSHCPSNNLCGEVTSLPQRLSRHLSTQVTPLPSLPHVAYNKIAQQKSHLA